MLHFFPRFSSALAAASIVGGALLGSVMPVSQEPSAKGQESAQEILRVLGQEPGARQGDFADRSTLLRAGFDAFKERMDAFDAATAAAVARELFAEDPAIWSAFCVESALRRGAALGAEDEAFAEASNALDQVEGRARGSAASELAIAQRRALLAAGFHRPSVEAAALGAALGRGGVDGVQIRGLAALMEGDHDLAASLFGSLIDRFGEPPPPGAKAFQLLLESHRIAPNAAPWALRGHALATLERLRAQ